MNPADRPDDDLRALLHDAVSDVHPEPGLDRIRRRTRPAPGVRRSGRWLGALAAAATVAAIVGGIALVNRPDRPPTKVDPAASSRTSAGTPTGDASGSPAPGRVQRALGIYYVGDTPQGPRLYREFQRVSVPPLGTRADQEQHLAQDRGKVSATVDLALQRPVDPDYRTSWPDGTRLDATKVTSIGYLIVSLTNPTTDLRTRPAGMSDAEATAAVQQLVYTAQAAVQNRNPVRFQLDGKGTTTLLGVDVSKPVAQLGQLDILALASITEPAEGAVVRGSFTANGVASSFEANVPWRITKQGTVVKSGYSTAAGWADRLYPWQTDPIDVSGLAPGSYTFEVMTDDPSAGEGNGPTSDTRTIVVRR